MWCVLQEVAYGVCVMGSGVYVTGSDVCGVCLGSDMCGVYVTGSDVCGVYYMK